jgi:hypothetical protein
MAKLIGTKYKTWEGAAKRCAFERAMNPGEVRRGDATTLYSYSVVTVDGFFRVQKEKREATKESRS